MINTSKSPSISSNQQASSSMPGIKIGTYDILGSIGQGNFSVCKLARSRLTNQLVAIKCVVKKNLDTTHLSRIYREIEIMKSIDHPNIIKLNQVMESKSMLYLVCEYASNGEIFDYIQKYGAMSEKMACEKFCQVISAVEYCHSKNIVHRDLKSENLLFDSKMNVKLVDFGFANHFDLINPLKTFCGSPPYAAPELFCGKKYYGPEVDIWSLGVILYVLVTGTLPFESENLQYLKQKILSCKYRVPYSMSHDCENLISHILVSNQSKRYKLQQIRLHKWIKANSPSFYYMSFNSNENSLNESNNSSYENESIEDANFSKNVDFKIKKKSSSFKTKSFKKKCHTPTSNVKNLNEEFEKLNNQVASNKNILLSNQSQSTQENAQNESESFYSNSSMGVKKSSTLSCISLPLFSFEEYYNKESQSSVLSSSNANLNSSNLTDHSTDDKNSLMQTKSIDLKSEAVNSQEKIPELSVSQISSLIKESQKENIESCSTKIKTPLSETHTNAASSSSQTSQYSLDLNKSFELKLNLKSETFTHLFSNSSSLDEGVESDLSSMSSSISSDLLSLSRSPNGSIIVSSLETKIGQKSYNQPIYGLLCRMTHKNSFCLSPGRSYRRQRFACFKKGLIKSKKIKNLNDLTEIKNELNFLMEDASTIKKNSLSFNLKKLSISEIPSDAQRQIILKKIRESLNQNSNKAEKRNDENNNQIKDEGQISNHNHLFKCILEKTDEDYSSYFHEESLAQRRKHLLKQTSISLNSVNEECSSNDNKDAASMTNNAEISNQIEINATNDISINIHQQKILNTDFKHYTKN